MCVECFMKWAINSAGVGHRDPGLGFQGFGFQVAKG